MAYPPAQPTTEELLNNLKNLTNLTNIDKLDDSKEDPIPKSKKKGANNAKAVATGSMQALAACCRDEASPQSTHNNFKRVATVGLAPLSQIPDAQSIFTVFKER